MRQNFINLYTAELKRLKDSDVLNFADFNKDKIQAIKKMLIFFNTTSDNELNKLPSIILKFNKDNYISNHELKFIQTRYYHLIKHNSIKNSKSNKINKSYLFGFVEETIKGFCVIKGNKLHKNNSVYEKTKECKNFMSKIVHMLKSYEDIIKEQDEKLFIRSIKKFNNAKIQRIEPNKDYKAPFYFEKDRIEAINYLQNTNLLIQIPSKNANGRLYNRYWNKLKKEDKINLLPSYTSYDINTSLYQFLLLEAKKHNLGYSNVKHYIENKQELRQFISKDTFNSLPYHIEKGYKIYGQQYILDLSEEIKCILNTILKGDSLFSMYESWESTIIQDFIDKNGLDNYVTNHDEILVHSKEKVSYVPGIFGIETAEERKEIVKVYNSKTQEDFIREREERIKEQDRRSIIIHYKGVLKRTKNFYKRQGYIYKIESLKVSFNENLLTESLLIF